MKRVGKVLAGASLACLFGLPVFAEERGTGEKGPVKTVMDGCQAELTTYCKDVSPGKGRVLACLYAHGDKLSGRCEYALYDASAQLERVIASLSYVAHECNDDLRTYCSAVRSGEGRLLDCLKKNESKLSDRCKVATKDVGLK